MIFRRSARAGRGVSVDVEGDLSFYPLRCGGGTDRRSALKCRRCSALQSRGVADERLKTALEERLAPHKSDIGHVYLRSYSSHAPSLDLLFDWSESCWELELQITRCFSDCVFPV